MAYDIVPSNLFSFPGLRIPSLWNEDDEWLNTSAAPSGLSVSEDEKNVYVEAALPGLDPKNIEVTFQDGYVWIRGEEKEEEKDKGRKYYRHATKSFSYRVAVPGEIDQNIEPVATHRHGVMKISFVKAPKPQPKKIQIKTE